MLNTGSPYRPVTARVRDDLKVSLQTNRGERTFVVADLLGLEFYHFNEQEIFLLGMVDGVRSVHEMKRAFEQEFAPYQIKYEEIQHYLVDFHKKALLTNAVSDRGRHLFRLGQKTKLKKRWAAVKNILAIRFRGVNPDSLFRALTPFTSWLFAKPAIVVNVFLMMASICWLATHFGEFLRRLPLMQEFFSGSNWLLLGAVLVVVKLLHELAHGVVFTKFGGRCHELGVMFLVFLPTLYVNTSDSWRMDDKWKRAAIAAAGVYLELVLAAICTFGWWFSKPGTLNYVFLNVMFLASVSALLFNGNPLLKFDAYYLLCDLIEIPNLQQRSQQLIRNWFIGHGLGVREGDEHLLPAHTKRWMVAYAIASFLYRIVVMYMIAFMVLSAARPLGLAPIAKAFAFVSLAMVFLMPLFGLAKYFAIPGRIHRIRAIRARVTTVILSVAFVIVFVVPLPDHVVCQFLIRPNEAHTIYVEHEAVLKEVHVRPGQKVHKGDKIATLRNIDVELEIAALKGKVGEFSRELRLTRLANERSSSLAGRMRELRQEMMGEEMRLRELERVQVSMVLRAPCDGTIMMEWQREVPTQNTDELKKWDGWALHAENINTTLSRGQPVCEVGNLTQVAAFLLIDQSDIRWLVKGQPVKLMLDSLAKKSYSSTIESISLKDADKVDPNVAQRFGGSVETEKTQRGEEDDQFRDAERAKPSGAVYEAIVMIPPVETDFEAGLRGTARVAVGKRTIASRVYRFLHKTFRIDL